MRLFYYGFDNFDKSCKFSESSILFLTDIYNNHTEIIFYVEGKNYERYDSN